MTAWAYQAAPPPTGGDTDMRKLTALAIAGVLCSTMVSPAYGWTRPRGPCSGIERITRQMPLRQKQHRSVRMIRCVFAEIAPGNVRAAIRVAKAESGLNPFAYNSWSGAAGLFQHLRRYWGGRAKVYLERRWFPNTYPGVSVFSARANTIAAAKMVKRGGWSAWTTY